MSVRVVVSFSPISTYTVVRFINPEEVDEEIKAILTLSWSVYGSLSKLLLICKLSYIGEMPFLSAFVTQRPLLPGTLYVCGKIHHRNDKITFRPCVHSDTCIISKQVVLRCHGTHL